jgi:hypothetical protein
MTPPLPAPPSPDAVAARLRAGDAAALARLADATYARALAVARSLGADEARAERAVLDAYVRLWFARAEAPADERLEAWVVASVGAVLAPRRAAPPAWRVRLRAAAARVAHRLREPRAPAARGCAGLA